MIVTTQSKQDVIVFDRRQDLDRPGNPTRVEIFDDLMKLGFIPEVVVRLMALLQEVADSIDAETCTSARIKVEWSIQGVLANFMSAGALVSPRSTFSRVNYCFLPDGWSFNRTSSELWATPI